MCKPPTVKTEQTDKTPIIGTQMYTKQSKRSLILKSILKWNTLPFNVRATENKTLFKTTLTEFLQRQHENFPLDRQLGSFMSYIYI